MKTTRGRERVSVWIPKGLKPGMIELAARLRAVPGLAPAWMRTNEVPEQPLVADDEVIDNESWQRAVGEIRTRLRALQQSRYVTAGGREHLWDDLGQALDALSRSERLDD